jgi:hypothetical protein
MHGKLGVIVLYPGPVHVPCLAWATFRLSQTCFGYGYKRPLQWMNRQTFSLAD